MAVGACLARSPPEVAVTMNRRTQPFRRDFLWLAVKRISLRGKIPLDSCTYLSLEFLESDADEPCETLRETREAFKLPRKPDQ